MRIADAAVQVQKAFGPALLESAYQPCLAHDLRKRYLTVKCEVIHPFLRLPSSVPRLISHPLGANLNLSQVAQLQIGLYHQLARATDKRWH